MEKDFGKGLIIKAGDWAGWVVNENFLEARCLLYHLLEINNGEEFLNSLSNVEIKETCIVTNNNIISNYSFLQIILLFEE